MPSITRQRTAIIWAIALCLAAMHIFAVSADAPDGTPTAVPSEEGTSTPAAAQTVQASPPVTATVMPTVTVAAEVTPTLAPTLVPAPGIAPTRTLTVTATAVPTPTPTTVTTPLAPTPPPVPTALAPTTYIAVLVGETVIPVGGTASGEVFVSLVDVESSFQHAELRLAFDPTIVRVDGVLTAATASAEVDNEGGEIVLVLGAGDVTPTASTATWKKVATITWAAQQEGRSVVTVGQATRFTTSGGQQRAPDASYHGMVFARAPGTIQGRVQLQGRESAGGVTISSSLSSARFDRERTDESGRFAIATSHGEGFYTIIAAAPGYLSAESDRPVKMTVDSVVDIGQITLLGGDVNGDNRIDIRDVAYVAYHFQDDDAKADLNRDGEVDILDLTLAAGNFGRLGPTIWQIHDQE